MNLKQDFPLLQNSKITYLDSGATSQKPLQVIRGGSRILRKIQR